MGTKFGNCSKSYIVISLILLPYFDNHVSDSRETKNWRRRGEIKRGSWSNIFFFACASNMALEWENLSDSQLFCKQTRLSAKCRLWSPQQMFWSCHFLLSTLELSMLESSQKQILSYTRQLNWVDLLHLNIGFIYTVYACSLWYIQMSCTN